MSSKAKNQLWLKISLSVAVIFSLVLMAVAVATVTFLLSTSRVDTTPAVLPNTSAGPTREELLRLVNQERAKVGVAPLVEDPRLDQSSQLKMDDMIERNYFGHVDANGKHGYEYVPPGICVQVAENMAWVRDPARYTARDHIYAFMHSTKHRDAMLNAKYSLVGFGISADGSKVVQQFCQTS